MMPRPELHLQERGDPTVRSVTIHGDLARIGRSVLCDVRLSGKELGDVEALIRRRGKSWYVQPTGDRSRLTIRGDRVREPILLADGQAFEVGDHRLEFHLRSAVEPTMHVVAVPSAMPPIVPEEPSSVKGSRPEPDAPGACPEPGPRQANRPWASPTASRPDPQDDWRRTLERCEESLRRHREARPPEFPRFARPEPSDSIRNLPRDMADRAVPPAPPDRLDVARDRLAPDAPNTFASEAGARVRENGEAREPTYSPVQFLPAHPGSIDEVSSEWLDRDEAYARAVWEASDLSVAPDYLSTSFEQLDSSVLEGHEPGEETEAHEARERSNPSSDSSKVEREPAAEIAPEPIQEAEAAGSVDPPENATENHPSSTEESRSEPPPRIESDEPEPAPRVERGPSPADATVAADSGDWPTIAMILSAQRAREVREEDKVSTSRMPRLEVLTASTAPRFVRLPRFLVGLPLLAVAFAVGLASSYLSWCWYEDACVAQGHDRLVVGHGDTPQDLARVPSLPRSTWWSTTADHLFARAAIAQTWGGSESSNAEAREMLDLVQHCTPWHPGAGQFRSVVLESESVELPTSRNVIPLVRAARRSYEAGNVDRAASLLGLAVEMGCKAQPDPEDSRRIDTDTIPPRWRLPEEGIFESVAVWLAALPPESRKSLLERLPAYAPLWLAVARAARPTGETETLLTALLERPDTAPPGVPSFAHRAGRAEAMALLGRPEEARRVYEELLPGLPTSVSTATCWANLSVSCEQLDDASAMHRARAEARRLGLDPTSSATLRTTASSVPRPAPSAGFERRSTGSPASSSPPSR